MSPSEGQCSRKIDCQGGRIGAAPARSFTKRGDIDGIYNCRPCGDFTGNGTASGGGGSSSIRGPSNSTPILRGESDPRRDCVDGAARLIRFVDGGRWAMFLSTDGDEGDQIEQRDLNDHNIVHSQHQCRLRAFLVNKPFCKSGPQRRTLAPKGETLLPLHFKKWRIPHKRTSRS
jgi:hypothetical protein